MSRYALYYLSMPQASFEILVLVDRMINHCKLSSLQAGLNNAHTELKVTRIKGIRQQAQPVYLQGRLP